MKKELSHPNFQYIENIKIWEGFDEIESWECRHPDDSWMQKKKKSSSESLTPKNIVSIHSFF